MSYGVDDIDFSECPHFYEEDFRLIIDFFHSNRVYSEWLRYSPRQTGKTTFFIKMIPHLDNMAGSLNINNIIYVSKKLAFSELIQREVDDLHRPINFLITYSSMMSLQSIMVGQRINNTLVYVDDVDDPFALSKINKWLDPRLIFNSSKIFLYKIGTS